MLVRSVALLMTLTLCVTRAASAQDADSDGVPNTVDLFPCDPNAAAESFAPSLGAFGTILLEDHWPVALDNDYDDVVIAYNYHYLRTAAGEVSKLRAVFHVLAAGGTIDHGLGLALPVPGAAASAVELRVGAGPASQLAPIAGEPNLTVELSRDIRAELFSRGSREVINADPSLATHAARTLEVVFSFSPAIAFPVDRAPHDVYVFRTERPSHEIHLPQHCGTSNMDTSLFGTGVDTSDPSSRRCFIGRRNIPAGLQVAELIQYPIERVDIARLYPMSCPGRRPTARSTRAGTWRRWEASPIRRPWRPRSRAAWRGSRRTGAASPSAPARSSAKGTSSGSSLGSKSLPGGSW